MRWHVERVAVIERKKTDTMGFEFYVRLYFGAGDFFCWRGSYGCAEGCAEGLEYCFGEGIQVYQVLCSHATVLNKSENNWIRKVGLENQPLIAYFGNIRTLIPEVSGQHIGNIRTL